MTRPLRRAGATWRILAHRMVGNGPNTDLAHHVQSDLVLADPDDAGSHTVTLEHTVLDEVVIGGREGVFPHVEQMTDHAWWLNVGGVHLTVRADRDGRPVRVIVNGVEDPQPGCEYVLDWAENTP